MCYSQIPQEERTNSFIFYNKRTAVWTPVLVLSIAWNNYIIVYLYRYTKQSFQMMRKERIQF